MPGTELFGAEERKEVNDVMETGILFRYGHDAQRNKHWKAKEFEAEVKKITGATCYRFVIPLSGCMQARAGKSMSQNLGESAHIGRNSRFFAADLATHHPD